MVEKGQEIDRAALADSVASRADDTDKGHVVSVPVRSVLKCEAHTGVCRACYGRSLATGKLAQIGDAVRIIAAQSIGEPGTQLTMRTFHIGGVASGPRNLESDYKSKKGGLVQFERINAVVNDASERVALSRTGELLIVDPKNKDTVRER